MLCGACLVCATGVLHSPQEGARSVMMIQRAWVSLEFLALDSSVAQARLDESSGRFVFHRGGPAASAAGHHPLGQIPTCSITTGIVSSTKSRKWKWVNVQRTTGDTTCETTVPFLATRYYWGGGFVVDLDSSVKHRGKPRRRVMLRRGLVLLLWSGQSLKGVTRFCFFTVVQHCHKSGTTAKKQDRVTRSHYSRVTV